MAKDKEDFNDWMDGAATPRNGQRGRVWDGWPDGIKDEIAKSIARNDKTDHKKIPITALQSRWREVYETEVSKDSLNRYCRTVLGRRSFTLDK